MIAERRKIAKFQSNFYCESYHKILRWFIVSVIIIWLLIAALIWKIAFHPTFRYYAVTSEGKIIPMQPVRIK